MKRSLATLLASSLLLGSALPQAESLSDIYELALENDAQLKAEQAQYLARTESEYLARSALLPQVSTSYSYTDTDADRWGQSRDFNDPPELPIIKTKSNTDTDTDGYSVSLSQAIFDLPAWFSFQSGKEISKQAAATFASYVALNYPAAAPSAAQRREHRVWFALLARVLEFDPRGLEAALDGRDALYDWLRAALQLPDDRALIVQVRISKA